jgi:hypothetical protein|tara:strand:+ start:1681 stop:1875 length:195 start_codon:yes stop_codon:yes gene_type:complete
MKRKPECLLHKEPGCAECIKNLSSKTPLKSAAEREFEERQEFEKRYTNFCRDMLRARNIILGMN